MYCSRVDAPDGGPFDLLVKNIAEHSLRCNYCAVNLIPLGFDARIKAVAIEQIDSRTKDILSRREKAF